MAKLTPNVYFAMVGTAGVKIYYYQVLEMVSKNMVKLKELYSEIEYDNDSFIFGLDTLNRWLDEGLITVLETEKDLLAYRLKHC